MADEQAVDTGEGTVFETETEESPETEQEEKVEVSEDTAEKAETPEPDFSELRKEIEQTKMRNNQLENELKAVKERVDMAAPQQHPDQSLFNQFYAEEEYDALSFIKAANEYIDDAEALKRAQGLALTRAQRRMRDYTSLRQEQANSIRQFKQESLPSEERQFLEKARKEYADMPFDEAALKIYRAGKGKAGNGNGDDAERRAVAKMKAGSMTGGGGSVRGDTYTSELSRAAKEAGMKPDDYQKYVGTRTKDGQPVYEIRM